MRSTHYIHDTESFPDFWCTTIKAYKTDEVYVYEISKRRNDLNAIAKFYKNFRCKLISFNGKHYDNYLVNYIVANHRKLSSMSADEVANQLYNVSKSVVYDLEGYKRYKYGHKWTDVDLFFFWSNLIRMSKNLSLKTIAIALNYDEIQELPYPPNKPLESYEKFDEVIRYNKRNDIGVTEKLCLFFEQQGEMELRKFVTKQFHINPWSLDGVNIGSEILKYYYKQAHPDHDFNKQTFRKSIKLKHVLLDNYDFVEHTYGFTTKSKPNSKERKMVFNSPYSALIFLEDLVIKDTKSLSYSIHFENPDGSTLISDYGSGGIHGLGFTGVLEADDKHKIIDIDVSSYYPTLVVENNFIPKHLDNEVFSKVFSNIIKTRLRSKKLKKESQFHDLLQSVLKLSINGTYGNFNNKYSWLYDPFCTLQVTINGQFILTELTEKLINNGISVYYQNTDGITCKVPVEKEQVLKDIVTSIENKFRLEFEYTYFSKFIVRDVNNFIAVTDYGGVKQKGWFVTKPNIEDSHNYLVIKKAIYEYFVNNKDPYEFIRNHDNIYDFCLSEKPSKKFDVYWGNDQIQRLNRYYISRRGKRIYKISNDNKKSSLQDVANWAVQLLNKYEDKPMDDYHIDYTFYISKCRNEIFNIENNATISTGNQLKLF